MVRTRIAPSPTGEPHVGTAYAALFNFCLAKKERGKFILRIEDTDRSRLVISAEDKILKSLKWLKLTWDEGSDVGGSYGPYRQSERLEIYQKFADELLKQGKAYRCFHTFEELGLMREKQIKEKKPPMYDRSCRGLTLGQVEQRLKDKKSSVIRLKVPLDGETIFEDLLRGEISFKNENLDDQILLKSDGWPTYHLASVVDDHLMEITHVIRAEEWLSSTPKHVLLYKSFGWSLPIFVHLPLLRNPDKTKISKRKNPISLEWYQNEGYLPEALLNFLALQGWSHPEGKEVFPISEMVDKFSLDKIVTSGPIFNLEKLNWINGEYIRSLSDKDLASKLVEFSQLKKDEIVKLVPLAKTRIKRLTEFDPLFDFYLKEAVEIPQDKLIRNLDSSQVEKILNTYVEKLKDLSAWKKETLDKIAREIVLDFNLPTPDLFMIIRVAVTGKEVTPPLFETLEVLGKIKVLQRLKEAMDLLSPP
ncbi:MAG: glutamate--tRNA ligase [Candidatus Woykebacteria bacterium RBG_13_40_7b]|uniref:Glutamate--tRNA ligase n=1 Tax=Candidatus Woykebacteria bacterium RBG_13_40_7b TaxID=1802594 RepID=A0A1G1W8Z3_9BACT|nr:MAG: glutamate--tRNA ligase [Candidatus Woykebacteria bacterium RBG_13_40_7b]